MKTYLYTTCPVCGCDKIHATADGMVAQHTVSVTSGQTCGGTGRAAPHCRTWKEVLRNRGLKASARPPLADCEVACDRCRAVKPLGQLTPDFNLRLLCVDCV